MPLASLQKRHGSSEALADYALATNGALRSAQATAPIRRPGRGAGSILPGHRRMRSRARERTAEAVLLQGVQDGRKVTRWTGASVQRSHATCCLLGICMHRAPLMLRPCFDTTSPSYLWVVTRRRATLTGHPQNEAVACSRRSAMQIPSAISKALAS